MLAPCPVSMISPLANCLDGSKVDIECGSILGMRRNVKNAKEYKAVNQIGGDNASIFWLERSI